jgi:hypothetical protein
MNTKLAVEYISDPINGLGPLGQGAGGAPRLLDAVISAAVGLITVIAGVWFIFLLITGGIAWMSAGGDKVKVEDAQKRLTTGLIGLIVVIAGIYLADLFGYLLGLDLLNPGTILSTLTPR